MTALLPGFEYQRVEVDGVTVNCATAGLGPPVLMLHGYPQNHLMWRDVAPALAEDHTVVLAATSWGSCASSASRSSSWSGTTAAPASRTG
jgi:pimeloyl-ACP methyl ester carboxylesterase